MGQSATQPMQYGLLSEEELTTFSGGAPHCSDPPWVVGHRYIVMDRGFVVWASTEAGNTALGTLPRGMIVRLLKTNEEQGILWGFLDPPRSPAAQATSPGWAKLEGYGSTRDALLSLGPDWDIGSTFRVRTGTIARMDADLLSPELCTLGSGDTVQILEFSTHEGADRKRLRAKVLICDTNLIGWVSPQNEAGQNLLLPDDGEHMPVSKWRRCRLPGMAR